MSASNCGDGYTSLGEAACETVISRSRFITYVYPIADEDDAAEKLRALKKRHYDATHVCYAYIADTAGNSARFSDDGEPSGTAGAPIPDVLKSGGYRKSLIAVVRYFGGVKLGAGGLTRAYAGCAAVGVKAAQPETYRLCDVFTVETDFADYNKILKNLPQTLCKIVKTEYNDCITAELADISGSTEQTVVDRTQGRARVRLSGRRYIRVD